MSSPPGTNLQNTGTPHLDEMTILLYLERQLDRARAAEVSAHTQECSSCRLLLRALERESRLLTRAMLEEEEPLPARLAGFQQAARRSLQWIWMVTFGLAATGVYALYTSYIEPVQNRLQDAASAGPICSGFNFPGRLLERMAIDDFIGGSVGAGYARNIYRSGSAPQAAPWLHVSHVARWNVRRNAYASGTTATEFRKGQNAEVTSSEVIKSDIFLSGDRLSVDGTVEGDVTLSAARSMLPATSSATLSCLPTTSASPAKSTAMSGLSQII